MTLELYKKIIFELENIKDSEVKEYLSTLVDLSFENENKKKTKSREVNTSKIYKIDKDTLEVIDVFDTNKEALASVDRERGSGISDAIRGRTQTHYAYGYIWIKEDEMEVMIKNLKKEKGLE